MRTRTCGGFVLIITLMGLVGGLATLSLAQSSPASSPAPDKAGVAPGAKKAPAADPFEIKNSLPCEFFGPCGKCDCPDTPIAARSARDPKPDAEPDAKRK